MSVKIKVMTILGAPLEGCNPLPMFHKKNPVQIAVSENFPEKLQEDLCGRTIILPYRMQDRYSRKRVPINMKCIEMENKYLKAVFWPENGGRLYSLFDKVNNRELLMVNPVYQPGNLAIRNAWFSGGIEWNFGCLGHNVFTCDNLYAAVLKDDKGNDFVRFYEYERSKGNLFQIDFHLPEDSPLLYSHVKLFNPNEYDTTTYWWTNIAIPEDGNTRVLSSSDMVIVVMSGKGLSYEKMPYLSSFEGKDLSYPHNATRSYDHFYQVPDETKTAWEAGAYNDGTVFFDRSTAPLLYHKMFCWGNHTAGKRWQDFLSDPDKGDYIEVQAGLARSQMHDKPFPAKSTLEWTQCFGGDVLDREKLHQEDFEAANTYLDNYVNSVIPEDELIARNEAFSHLAEMEVNEENLVHTGSGWGALEEARRAAFGEDGFPKSVCFPKATIGQEQYPWYALLTEGKLTEEAPDQIPSSWMVADKWMKLLEESMDKNGEDWYSMLHYGVMNYEKKDEEHVAYIASRWSEYPKYTELARKAFLRSVELKPSVWAYRCLFCIERDAENDEMAEYYYDKAFELEDAYVDFAFAAEYMGWLNSKKKYEKSWNLYCSLPDSIKNVDRMMLCAAMAAIKLRKIDFVSTVFEREYADIREGEASLTDIWFEYSALKLAKERGLGENISVQELDQLIDEAWDICPPPQAIDFRMSFDKKNRYRVEG